VAAAALALRLIHVWQVHATGLVQPEELDPGFYYGWAKSIAAGDLIGQAPFVQSPLYAYLLGLFMAVFGTAVTPILVAQTLVGAGTVALTCVAGRLYFDVRRGLIAGLLLAVYGPFVFYEGMVMKTFLSPFFTILLAVVLGLAARRAGAAQDEAQRSAAAADAPASEPPPAPGGASSQVPEGASLPVTATRLFGAAGLVFGCLCLDRDNFVLLAPVLALLAAWLAGGGGGALAPRRLRAAGAFALGAALVILPVTIRNFAVSREVVLLTTGGGEVFFIGNNHDANGLYVPPAFVRPDPRYEHADFVARATEIAGHPLSPMESSWFWFHEGLKYISGDPLAWTRLLWLKFVHFWNWYELPDNLDYEVMQQFAPLLKVMNRTLPPAGMPAPAVPVSGGAWLPIRLHLFATFGTLAPLGLLGIALSRRRWRTLLPLYVLIFGYMVTVMFFFNFSRFRVPVVPILALFAAEGLAGCARGARALWNRARPALAPRAFLVAALFVVALTFCNLELPRGVVPAIEQALVIGNEYYAEGRFAQARSSFDVGLILLGEGPSGPAGDAILKRQLGATIAGDALLRELEIESVAKGPQFKGIHLGIHHGLGIAMLQEAQGLLEAGRRDQAQPLLDQSIVQLREALKIAPSYLMSHRKLARAYQLEGDTPQAVEWLTKAIDLWPEDLPTRLDFAEMLYGSGRYRDALAQLDAARHYNPSMDPHLLGQVYFDRGLIWMRGLEDAGKALYDMEKAIALSPDHPQAAAIESTIRDLKARHTEAVPDEPSAVPAAPGPAAPGSGAESPGRPSASAAKPPGA
jgi:tetratricopeptide (TPR) repeat protein